MFVLGLLMQGHIYKPNGGDILEMLGFVGDLGGRRSVSRLRWPWVGARPWFQTPSQITGTKFMIVAGLLNFIAVADAYHIAIGKKQ